MFITLSSNIISVVLSFFLLAAFNIKVEVNITCFVLLIIF